MTCIEGRTALQVLSAGNLNHIMGGKVAKEEARILDGLVKE